MKCIIRKAARHLMISITALNQEHGIASPKLCVLSWPMCGSMMSKVEACSDSTEKDASRSRTDGAYFD